MENSNNINQEPQNTPVENTSSQEPQTTVFQEKESKVGPIIGSLIVIVIILVGGIYFWSTQIEKINLDQETDIAQEEDFSEVNSVEAELETIDFDEIDAELDAIEAEFEAEA